MLFINHINNYNKYLYLKYSQEYNEYYIDIQQYEIVYKYVLENGYDITEFNNIINAYLRKIMKHNATRTYDNYQPEYIEWRGITIIDYTSETYFR